MTTAATAADVSTPTVRVAGSELDAQLSSMTAELSIHRPSRVVVEYADTLDLRFFNGSSVAVGDPLELLIGVAGAARTSVFEGDVVAIGVSSTGGPPTMRIEALARSHRLHHAFAVTTFMDQSLTDIVEAVASKHDLRAAVSCPAADAQQYPYLLQTQSDAGLLDMLARRVGAHWWVEGDQLHLAARATDGPAATVTRADMSAFSIGYDGVGVPDGVEARSWDPDTTRGHVGSDAVGSAPDAHLGSTASFVTRQYGAARAGKLVVGEPRSADQKEAERLATSVASRFARRGVDLEVTTGPLPAVAPGAWVTIEGLGRQLGGDWFVTDVVHRYAPRTQVTTTLRGDGSGGPDPATELAADVATTTSNPLLAIVTDMKDPERLGRVKVKFPSLGEQVGSHWARVTSPGAGSQRGLDARPQVDDVVAVVFEHGDSRFPIVVGGTWTKQNAHADPDVGDDEVQRTSIRSRSGASLVFFDTADQPTHKGADRLVSGNSDREGVDAEKGIGLSDADQVAGLLLSPKGLVAATDGKPLVLSNGKASLKLLPDGTIELVGKELKVTLQQNGTIKASQKLLLEGTTELLAKTSSAELKLAAVTSRLKAAGILQIKGAQVKIN